MWNDDKYTRRYIYACMTEPHTYIFFEYFSHVYIESNLFAADFQARQNRDERDRHVCWSIKKIFQLNAIGSFFLAMKQRV